VKAGTERREMKKKDGRKDFQNKEMGRKDFEKGKPGMKKAESVNNGKPGMRKAESVNKGKPGMKKAESVNNGKPGNRKAESVNNGKPGKRKAESVNKGKPGMKKAESVNNGKPGNRKAESVNKGKGVRTAAEKEVMKGSKGSGVKREEWNNKKTKARQDGDRREDRKQGSAWENKNPRAVAGNRENKNSGATQGKKQGGIKKVNGVEVCPVSKKCGGCQYQGIPYQEQLKLKEKEIRKWIGKFCKVNAVIGMDNPYHYRNKVHAVFDRDKRGNPICGVYQAGTHNVVPIESCMIEDQKADEIIQSIRGLLKSFKIRTYDEDTGYGLLRHVLVKRGFTTNEIMVVLVTASPVFPSKNNFVGAIRKIHPEITTIIQNVNARGTSMVLGDKEKTLFGKGYIEDVLCGCTFRISSKSFYQVNPVQTEVLYKKAIDAAGLTGNELVIDAYCGIGTIGLIASKKAKQVIGVELNKDAVRDAVTNAKRNEIENVRFYCADAGDFMADMAAKGEKADVVFMDPPRSGSTEQFIDSMVQMGPEKVVYVSCNPETLGRDLEYLTKKGYGCKGSWGVDMFAWTGHVETVVLMSRVKK